MDLPAWANVLLFLIAILIAVVIVLVVAGRVLLARELALLVPNLIRLFGGLLRDPRVPLRAKVVLAVASVWLASPIDLIPEFIPIVGSIFAAIPAIAMAFIDSPHKALWVAVGYILIQFVENHVLVPVLMKRGVDLPPAMTLGIQALMSVLFGFLGLLVAVPLLAVILTIVRTMSGKELREISAEADSQVLAHQEAV